MSGFLYHAGGSGQERATLTLLLPETVVGAEIRRISIGFEPDTVGRFETPELFHERFLWSSALSSAFLRDLFNLSTSRLWNLFNEFELPVFGGEEPVLLIGLWRELCDARDEVLEKCLDVSGTERWAGDVKKSEPGEVDSEGPSDLEHSDTWNT